jgi:hypothetical protein
MLRSLRAALVAIITLSRTSRRAQFFRVQLGDAPLVLFLRCSLAMVAVRASKVANLHAESPLEDAGISKQVLTYAGAGEFIFYAPISKLWLECYRAVPTHDLQESDTIGQFDDLPVVPEMTLWRAVFASASRVKLAHELGLRFDDEDEKLQFYVGSLACIAVLVEAHRLGMPLSTDMLDGAACSGKLSTVIWLHKEHNCELNDIHETSRWCAGEGHVDVLRWLKQQGAEFNEGTMLSAAMYGQQATCAYLLSEGCSWHVNAVYAAAIMKHWDTVRWLHEHDYPWDFDQTCVTAAERGSIKRMTYMLQQDDASAAVLSKMLNAAGASSYLAAAQWLRFQRGAAWPQVLRFNGTSWSGDTLEWARAEGCDSPLH